LIALALTARFALEASASSFGLVGTPQEQSQPVEAQVPLLPVQDSMVEYQGLTVAEIR
jgi:hypothetical protein